MSELAPETPSAPAPAKGLAGKLQHKIGPLPLWLWIGLGGGVLLLLARRGGGAGNASGGTDGTGPVDTASTPAGSGVDVPLDPGSSGGDSGGFPDPIPQLTDDFQFPDPSSDPSPSPNPAPADPVMHPLLTADIRHYLAAKSGYNVDGVSHPIGIGGGILHPMIVHSGDSSAGRIAAATTPYSVTPAGQIAYHASSYGGTRGHFTE